MSFKKLTKFSCKYQSTIHLASKCMTIENIEWNMWLWVIYFVVFEQCSRRHTQWPSIRNGRPTIFHANREVHRFLHKKRRWAVNMVPILEDRWNINRLQRVTHAFQHLISEYIRLHTKNAHFDQNPNNNHLWCRNLQNPLQQLTTIHFAVHTTDHHTISNTKSFDLPMIWYRWSLKCCTHQWFYNSILVRFHCLQCNFHKMLHSKWSH